MQNIKYFTFFILLLNFQIVVSQSVEIYGKVESSAGVENIHVINKTAQVFTTTNKIGEFEITAKLNDTLMFSSIQHIPKLIVVNDNTILIRKLTVKLEEQINMLDEVLVGKVLTGDLLSDIENVEGDPPINFFDVGIPGYTGKIATQSERRLHEAGEFKPKMLLGLLTGGMPLNPILNGISGRTKELKNRVEIEAKEALMKSIKVRLGRDFLISNPLEEDQVADFFYFCSDDENFIKYCKDQTDFEILIFLRMKYQQYKENKTVMKD
ncbi:hypothetical protein [Wocania ichthyoenteri]|uniref:hypothetical protein n=1 Tax=Wocania ichthyoenteri TaxID=1230531 RepID=UPI00053D8B90|nr:hypothetical protein [Wocania ichthyoenteri]